MDAKIDIEKKEDYVIMHFSGSFHSGEFDFPNEIKNNIKEFVRDGIKKILIDFENVIFFGSDGIGSITNGHYTACGSGGRVVPYALPEHIHAAFKIVGLDKVFQICKDLEEALIYLNQKVK